MAILFGFTFPARAHPDIDVQIAEVSRRIEARPEEARSWLRRGELHRFRGDWDAAERDYRRAAALDPQLHEVDYARGSMLLEAGRPAEALSPLGRFILARPATIAGRIARARALGALGDRRSAVPDWDAALLRAGDDARPEYYLERADAVIAADPGAKERAISGLIEGYRYLGGPVALRRRILELDPHRALPRPVPERAPSFPGPPSESTTLVRGPYLQRGTPTALVVRWRTAGSSDGVVRYGAAPDALSSTATDASVTTEHVVALTGLSPDSRYYYSVGSSTQVLAGGTADTTFMTPPAAGTTKPFRVWVLGDSGTADANAAAVRDAYTTYAGGRPTDLWMMLGDNAYESGTDAEYQQAVFAMYPQMLRQSVLWPTLGNHDGMSADSATESGPYYDIFTLPRAGEAGGVPSGTEAYYAFDYGNVHFVCLDSYESSRSPTGPMLTWLDQDLAATTKDWIVAFWHHPPYTKGSHDSDVETELIDMRENANPILEAHGVDLVLTGHSHSYERSFLIDGHYGDSTTFSPANVKDGGSGRPATDGAYEKPLTGPDPHEGAVYAVAGSSGQISGGPLDHPAMYLSLNELGSMVLDFNGNRLDATFLQASGTVGDTFSLIKQPSLLPLTDFEATPRIGPAPLSVQLADKTLNGPTSWAWDLDGDGTTDSALENPSHSYLTPGRYTVSLTATNVAGSRQATKSRFICVTAASPPAAVSHLIFGADRATLAWTAPGLAASYDVVRGDLATLRSSRGNFSASVLACVANDVPSPSAIDGGMPAAGEGSWYLARAQDCAGRPGTYDDGSQAGGRDAGVAAAAAACP